MDTFLLLSYITKLNPPQTHTDSLTLLVSKSECKSNRIKIKGFKFLPKIDFCDLITILSFPPGIRGVVYICKSLKTNVLLRSQKQYIRICIVSFMLILTLIRSPVHIRIFAIFCLSSLQYLRCIAYQIS